MIDIGKFAKPLVLDEPSFRFGTNTPAEIATQLRALADSIERRDVIVQKIQGGQIASMDDYFVQAIFIEFAEREPIKPSLADSTKRVIGKIESVDVQHDSITLSVVQDKPDNSGFV